MILTSSITPIIFKVCKFTNLLQFIAVESVFNDFVEDFGGELINKLFEGKGKRPDNADYFLFDRNIVAELKCLDKNFFNDKNLGEKLNKAIN